MHIGGTLVTRWGIGLKGVLEMEIFPEKKYVSFKKTLTIMWWCNSNSLNFHGSGAGLNRNNDMFTNSFLCWDGVCVWPSLVEESI